MSKPIAVLIAFLCLIILGPYAYELGSRIGFWLRGQDYDDIER